MKANLDLVKRGVKSRFCYKMYYGLNMREEFSDLFNEATTFFYGKGKDIIKFEIKNFKFLKCCDYVILKGNRDLIIYYKVSTLFSGAVFYDKKIFKFEEWFKKEE